jgi:hypothetical protein
MGYISDKIAQLEAHDKLILNALIVAGIVFVSSISTTYPPTLENVYSSMIGFTLALLTQLKTITSDREPPKLGMLLE